MKCLFAVRCRFNQNKKFVQMHCIHGRLADYNVLHPYTPICCMLYAATSMYIHAYIHALHPWQAGRLEESQEYACANWARSTKDAKDGKEHFGPGKKRMEREESRSCACLQQPKQGDFLEAFFFLVQFSKLTLL